MNEHFLSCKLGLDEGALSDSILDLSDSYCPAS